MTERKGRFIVLEGLDGSGKSTQARMIEEYLVSRGFEVMRTGEPQSDRPTGKLLREILGGNEKCDPRVTAALFAADRIDHVTRPGGILEAIVRGSFVICDRYYLSNLAYNSSECGFDWIAQLNSEAARLCKPDLHIFVDVPPERSFDRLKNRQATEIYEKLDYLARVRKNYLAVFEKLKDSENIAVIDGTPDKETVFREILPYVEKLI